MDNLEFLDLTGLERDEICKINTCLLEKPAAISFPWNIKKLAARGSKKSAAGKRRNNGMPTNFRKQTANISPQVPYLEVPYNQNQLQPCFLQNHYHQTPVFTNFHHPAQVLEKTSTGIHFMYQPYQGFNHTEAPIAYQNSSLNAVNQIQNSQEMENHNGVISEKSPEYVKKQNLQYSDPTHSIPAANNYAFPVPALDKTVVKFETSKTEDTHSTSKIVPNKKVEIEAKTSNISSTLSENANSTKADSTKKIDNGSTVKISDSLVNGIKSNDIVAPVNCWNKKSWVSLFNKEEPKLNGDLKPVSNTNEIKYETIRSEKHGDPAMYRLGEYLSKYKINGKASNLQPRGLINKSNYCYINSILQSLLACPPLCNLLLELCENLDGIKDQSIPMIENMCQFIKEFGKLSDIPEARPSKKNKKKRVSFDMKCDPFEAVSFYTMLNGTRSDSFLVEGRQEDAEEFLGLLLNGLNDEMMSLMQGIQEESVSLTEKEVNQDPDEWKVMGPKNKGNITRKVHFDKTPISDIFGGLLCSKIHKTGDESTMNIQPFLTLQLNIEKATTIMEALEQLTLKNQLEGLRSSKTKQKVEAWQQVLIEQLPVVLILHLKCFDYQPSGCTKIMKILEFPIDLQVDSKLLSNRTGPLSEKQYKLFAVVYHEGKEASKGHYIADVFHTGFNAWLRFDDSKIKTITQENVMNPQGYRVPYLLFYRRTD